ncbi:hypothetical protein EJB05_45883, partial [Eragrostis curvula]
MVENPDTVDLIRNERVSIVIGPQRALQAEFITYLANKTKVPVISFSATRDALSQYHVPYFLRACAKDSSQAASIAAFIKNYGWKNVVVVYEDDNYGVGILPSITDALQDVEAHVIYRFAIPAFAPDYCIDKELYKLMSMQTRVFIVHMLPARASHFYARASAAGMMTEGYVWIVTDNVGIVLDVLPEHTAETMQGVVGFRPYVAKSARILDFRSRFVTLFGEKYRQDYDVRMTRPTVFQYWAHDVAWAVAIAAEKVKRSRFPNIGFQTAEYVGKNLLDDLLTSPAGPELLSSISEGDFDGLAGRFRFVDRHMQVPVYEVVNVIGEKANGIGFWSPGYSTTVPKGWDLPVNAKKLKIGVPVRREFKFLVDVESNPATNSSSVYGYSIDVFEATVKKLPYALPYEYVPVNCANNYDELISQVYFKIKLSKGFSQKLSWLFELYGKLVVPVNCKEAPTFSDRSKTLLLNGDFVGHQNGSFVLARLEQLGFDERKIKVFSTLEEYAKALRDGSKHGGVSAIFDEIPYLNTFLAQYGQEFQIVRTDGFGFVFPRGSPLVPDLSRAILNLTEGCEGFHIQKKWFRDAVPSLDNGNSDTSSAHLSSRSFKGLFIINGTVLIIRLLTHLPQFICTKLRNANPEGAHGSGGTATDNEPQQLQDGMSGETTSGNELQQSLIGISKSEEIASENEPQQLQDGMGRSRETASENEPQQLHDGMGRSGETASDNEPKLQDGTGSVSAESLQI